MSNSKLHPLLIATFALALPFGCEPNPSTTAPGSVPFPVPVGNSNPAGALSYGTPSGMGFYTGDAAQAGGLGSGLASFHDVGAAGTSGTITDIHDPESPREAAPGAPRASKAW